MALTIDPSPIVIESFQHSSTIKLTLENTFTKPVHYKFRLPPTDVIKITPPWGKLLSSGKTELSLSYDVINNIGIRSLISFQLKYIQVEKDDDSDTETVFTGGKSATQTTRYINVTFQDEKHEDEFFYSPMSRKMGDDDVEKPKETWWRKKGIQLKK